MSGCQPQEIKITGVAGLAGSWGSARVVCAAAGVGGPVGDSGCVTCPLWSGVDDQPWSTQKTQKTQLSTGLLLKAGLL